MLVIRKDITSKLRSAKLLLINLKLFGEETVGNDYGRIWERDHTQVKDDMDSIGIDILGYRSGRKVSLKVANKLKIDHITLKSDLKKDLISQLQGKYSFKDIVLVGAELADIEIARLSRFSVATAVSPLELKMESDYVSNFSAMDVYQELGNLILNAKDPYKKHQTKSI